MTSSPTLSMGWFCSYTPIEIFLAAGFTPIRIGGHSDPIAKADSYMHPNLCQYVRACLDRALEGDYDNYEGVVFVNSCDAMRRLFDVWKKHIPQKFTHIMDLPIGRSERDYEYLRNEFQKLKTSLEEFTKRRISEKAMGNAINIFIESRSLFHRLNDLRIAKPPLISGTEVMKLISQFFSGDIQEWNKRVKGLLEKKRKMQLKNPESKNPRILLSGSPIHDPEIIAFIEKCGLDVVFEDLCTGSRFFDVDIIKTGDTLMDLSRAYLNRTPCARMMLLEERADGIKKNLGKFHADGVIYYSLKFCDTALYDVPALKKILNESGINVLFLEGDCTLGSFGQLKTRIEAFAEILNK